MGERERVYGITSHMYICISIDIFSIKIIYNLHNICLDINSNNKQPFVRILYILYEYKLELYNKTSKQINEREEERTGKVNILRYKRK